MHERSHRRDGEGTEEETGMIIPSQEARKCMKEATEEMARVQHTDSCSYTLLAQFHGMKYYLCQGHFVLFDPTYRNIIGGYSPVVMYL